MLVSEKIAFLLFACGVAAVYLLEVAVIVRAVQIRLRGKGIGRVLWSKPAIVVHGLAILGVGCFLYGRFVEPGWVEVNRFEIATAKLKEGRFRIVHISDLHCGKSVLNEERIVPLINELGADVIVFTGDALNEPEGAALLQKTLGALEAKVGKFAVRGNFELGRWWKAGLYDGTGFRLLERESVVVEKEGELLQISGLRCDLPDEMGEVMAGVSQEHFSVFLHHWSDLIDEVSGENVDLYLCGHTHGGQIALPFYGAIITLSKLGKKYEGGMYTVGETRMYVNRGLGLEPPPAPKVRFLARPEVAVFDIVPQRRAGQTE